MILKFKGETSLNKLPKLIKEVTADIQQRAGIPETQFKIKDAELGLIFKVGEEMHYLNVEHEGVPEIFKVAVELDEKGNIKKAVDNEKESFMDDYSKARAKGVADEIGRTEIESVYNDSDLDFHREENGGDLVCKYYKHKQTGELVERFYRDGVLVGEAGYKVK
jgi:hypothetical protein